LVQKQKQEQEQEQKSDNRTEGYEMTSHLSHHISISASDSIFPLLSPPSSGLARIIRLVDFYLMNGAMLVSSSLFSTKFARLKTIKIERQTGKTRNIAKKRWSINYK
jgi:hypothetical protein